jgi:glucan phosphoethanolaminetransferase (alkaline phosphatase superfamily)
MEFPDRDSLLWLYMTVFHIVWALVFVVILTAASAFATDNTLLLAENVVLFVTATSIATSAALYGMP